MSDPLNLMEQIAIFQHLSTQEKIKLIPYLDYEITSKDSVIFKADKPAHWVYILASGSIKLTRLHRDGKERIVHIVIVNDLFGAAVALRKGLYPVTAICLEKCSLFKIESKNFQDHFISHKILGPELINQLSQRIHQAHDDLTLMFDSVEKRILYFLWDLNQRLNVINKSNNKISIPLTNQNIANRIGSTVETVIRTTRKLRDKGIIGVENKYYTLISITSIRKILEL